MEASRARPDRLLAVRMVLRLASGRLLQQPLLGFVLEAGNAEAVRGSRLPLLLIRLVGLDRVVDRLPCDVADDLQQAECHSGAQGINVPGLARPLGGELPRLRREVDEAARARRKAEQRRQGVILEVDIAQAVDIVGQGERQEWRQPQEQDDLEPLTLDGAVDVLERLVALGQLRDLWPQQVPREEEADAGGGGATGQRDRKPIGVARGQRQGRGRQRHALCGDVYREEIERAQRPKLRDLIGHGVEHSLDALQRLRQSPARCLLPAPARRATEQRGLHVHTVRHRQRLCRAGPNGWSVGATGKGVADDQAGRDSRSAAGH
eukprot:CAMPEP_0195163536 /NCGR_PEP_ID=MMETSP0448-20130528/188214_1 /TAXON_ID=66468 /ORGANISM="Heterocapsa triquestra, Strain CCMP 448" /LENGTH=320 /DNA_ID=CAMNT_0040202333 /DNA_START=467 /DNA_END=1430 /DNA_ORIENTATION=-